MKQESKPDGHYGSKASGTEETAGKCYIYLKPKTMESTKILYE